MNKLTVIVGVMISIVVAAGFVYGLSSEYSLMHQEIGLTPLWMKLLSLVPFGIALFIGYKLVKGDVEGIGYVVALGALLALALAVLMNFGNNTY